MPLGQIGQVPNNSTFQGRIRSGEIEGVTTSTWNPRSGGTSKTVFKGTQEQITNLARDAKTDGWEYSIQGGHVWTLEVTFPYDIIVDLTEEQSNPLFTWELTNTPFEKDVSELNDRPFVGHLSTDSITAVDTKLKSNGVGLPYSKEDSTSLEKVTDGSVLYALRRSGARSKQGIVQTLKRTIIVGNQFNPSSLLKPQYNYKVFTTDALLSTYNVNTNVLNLIPDVIVNALPRQLTVSVWINADQGTTEIPKSGFTMDGRGIVTYIGWLQFPPEYQMVAVNKVQITQHWTFNQWSAGPYGLYDAWDGTNGFPNYDPKKIFVAGFFE